MNSLLQTLYMTPEFRRSLYQFRYSARVHGPAEDCIPLQMQQLFARLQLKSASYQDTLRLTRSFQWGRSESFEQCDVQEFCRVLFDAIELSVKQSPDLKNLINDMFSGQVRSWVECLGCGLRSNKYDTFLDLSLTLTSEDTCSRSLYDALDSYFKSELLSAENQYQCQVCERKTDALKSQELTQLPYILFLHLKRFSIDPVTFTRCKINSEVQFPFVLNMTQYLSSETINESNQNGLGRAQEHLYELYSVLVHSGSALGGHYSAYILSFEDHQWYLFDDTHVQEATDAQVTKTYGDSLNSNAQLYTGSSAYVLCYRKLDPKNLAGVSDEEVPLHVRDFLENEYLEVQSPDLTSSAEMIKVQIHFRHQTIVVEVSDNESLTRILDLAKIEYGLQDLPDSDLRLRSVDGDSGMPLETFLGREHLPLRSLDIGNFHSLELEVKEPTASFEEIDQDGMTLNVYIWGEECWNMGNKRIHDICKAKRICITKRCIIADLLFLLAAETDIPIELLTVITALKEYLTSPNYHLALASEVLKNNMAVYVEALGSENADSKWEAALDRERYQIMVKYMANGVEAELGIDSRVSFAQLKECIAAQQHLDISSFSLKCSGEEIRDLSQAVHRLVPPRSDFLSLALGDVLRPDEAMLNLVLADLTPAGEVCYIFTPLCQHPVQDRTLCIEVQRAVLQKLGKAEMSETQVRVRPRFGMRLGRPMSQLDSFKDCLKYEQRNFAIQILPQSGPDLDPDEVVILLKVWKRFQFVSVQEITLLRHLTLEEFGQAISSCTGLNFSCLQLAKSSFAVKSSEALSERWVTVCENSYQILSGSPWFLGPDGALFL